LIYISLVNGATDNFATWSHANHSSKRVLHGLQRRWAFKRVRPLIRQTAMKPPSSALLSQPVLLTCTMFLNSPLLKGTKNDLFKCFVAAA
jgi:hypothetical protein